MDKNVEKILNAIINELADSTIVNHYHNNKGWETTANMLNLAMVIKKIMTDPSYRDNWLEAIEELNNEEDKTTIDEAYSLYETLPYPATEFYYDL